MSTGEERPRPQPTDRPSSTPSRDATAEPDDSRRARVHNAAAAQELIAADTVNLVPGDPPVPVTVWRVSGGTGDSTTGLNAQAAALLVALYSRAGDTIVDFTTDPAVAGAAGAAGCRYLAGDTLRRQIHSGHTTTAARLVLMRWPSDNPHIQSTPSPLIETLTDSRQLLARDGCTIVALAPPPATGYADHARRLISAAHQAGLGYLQHILVVTAPIPGAAKPRHAAPADAAVLRAAAHLHVQADLLAFVLRRRHN